MGTIKKTSKDFKLISNITKARIKGLIEKRLTTQTIALFAQEYESYDAAVRLEILEYIFFLLENEEEQLNAQAVKADDVRNKILMDRRKMEFNEKKSNVLKIQQILVENTDTKKINLGATKANRVKFENTEKRLELGTPVAMVNKSTTSGTKKPKVVKEKETNFTKMIKEAEERERQAIKEAQKKEAEAKALKAQLAKQKAAEAKALKEAKAKKQAELAAKKAASAKAKSDAKENAKTKAKAQDKDIKITAVDRDYEKEQREKERLWLELYGKTRTESLVERDQKKASEFKPTGEDDKRPSMQFEIDPTDFRIGNDIYLVEELTNPKNRCYSFWNTIKAKYGVPSIYVLIHEKPQGVLKKVNRQRKKYEKKLRRKGGTTPKAETIKKMANAKNEAK
ncbi:hypothetical protein [Spiroplasma clarkii]|uniref:Uncharacterized protein n=1 Tax=Spiroplasma clarkii TaxID=2139 RepID=A0A2K8KJ58_9MOLU|nr:hypothetical protein [Spiroplasma clarkii]ATX71292.1 hypothetical protein SCLAR_v1c09900 [Spiroplasma clarkii]